MKVLNKKTDTIPLGNSVYIGRPSVWGNPYAIGRDGTREEVIQKYWHYLQEKPELIALAKELLPGKDLVCFCAPEACHGDVLIWVANYAGDA